MASAAYSPPSQSSPDSSPIYRSRPRPIRPLPSRGIKDRLPKEIASTIVYPPSPATTVPMFYFPSDHAGPGEPSEISDAPQYLDSRSPMDRLRDSQGQRELNDAEVQFADEHLSFGRAGHSTQNGSSSARPNISIHRGTPQYQKMDASRLSKPPPTISTTSSADGYESFENTNNKKKRKIPIPNEPSGSKAHQAEGGTSKTSHLSHDQEQISPDEFTVDDVGQYYGSGNPASSIGGGISGAGRARYGRTSGGRSSAPRFPLASSSDALNNRSARTRRDWTPSGVGSLTKYDDYSHHEKNKGIISEAIAESQRAPPSLVRGQENISLLQQGASKKTDPTKTQFTFTSNEFAWPGVDPGGPSAMNNPRSGRSLPIGDANAGKRMVDQAVQSNQHLPNIGLPGQVDSPSQQGPHSRQQNTGAMQDADGQPKKSRRRPGREYALAARQRRLDQEYANCHNPPNPEDIWICEFCEYESIFGTQPLALMRQYEIKDRDEKKRIAEKRRLLEKAKMKGRKGKKGTKAAAKNSGGTSSQPSQHQQPIDPTSVQPQDDDIYSTNRPSDVWKTE